MGAFTGKMRDDWLGRREIKKVTTELRELVVVVPVWRNRTSRGV